MGKIVQILGDWGEHKDIVRIPDNMHYVLETVNHREITENEAKEIENAPKPVAITRRGCRFW